MSYLLIAYLIIVPFSYWVGSESREVQEIVFQVSTTIVILSSLFFDRKRTKHTLFDIALFCFTVWMLAVQLLHGMGWSVWHNCLLGVLLYHTVKTHINKDDIKLVFRGVFVLTTMLLTYLFFQYIGFDLMGQMIKMPLRLRGLVVVPHCSFFGLKAAMGCYLTFALLAVMNLSVWGMLLMIPIALSYSTGAVLAAFIGSLFFLWHRRRIFFWWLLIPTIIGSAIFIGYMDAPTGMYGSRIGMWGLVVQDTHYKPFGHGLDSFRNDNREGAVKYFKYAWNDETIRLRFKEGQWVMGQRPPERFFKCIQESGVGLNFWDHPHNEFVWLAYEAGFPALLFLGWMLWLLWRRFRRSRYDSETVMLASMIIALLVMCMTQFPFHLARVGHTIPIILGLFIVATED